MHPEITPTSNFHHFRDITSENIDAPIRMTNAIAEIRGSSASPFLRENIAKEAVVYIDEAKQYTGLASEFADHDFTTHSKGEYVSRENPQVHTNPVKGFYYSIFKRGM